MQTTLRSFERLRSPYTYRDSLPFSVFVSEADKRLSEYSDSGSLVRGATHLAQPLRQPADLSTTHTATSRALNDRLIGQPAHFQALSAKYCRSPPSIYNTIF